MISLVSQMLAFVLMIITGFMVGLMFDVYRVIRTLTRPRAKGSMIMDLCFWIWVTPTIFVMLLMGNWGELRLYVFLGAALGLFVYFQFVSAKVLFALLALTRWLGSLLVKTMRFVVHVVRMPMQLMQRLQIALRHSRMSPKRAQRPGWRGSGGKQPAWLQLAKSFRFSAFMHSILPWGKAWPFGRR